MLKPFAERTAFRSGPFFVHTKILLTCIPNVRISDASKVHTRRARRLHAENNVLHL